jgi:hypothetical protein
MALIPLNTFKTKTKILPAYSATTATIAAYTAPIGVTSIILMAQIANITTQTQYVNFEHYRNRKVLKDAQGYGEQPGNTRSVLVNEFAIPANDAASMLTGKLIIEELDSIVAYTGNSGTCQLVLSILETATE